MGRVAELHGQPLCLDTNVFVYALEGYAEYRAQLLALFDAIDQGHIHAVTSELTIAEALVKPFLDNSAERQAAYQQALQTSPHLLVAPVSRPILLAAAQLRAAHGLRLPDAIDLATAQKAGCQTFLTNDRRLRSTDLTILALAELA